jgi:hypothetical protein
VVGKKMILVSTSNKNMTRFIGQDVTTAYVGKGEFLFITQKGSYWKSVVKGSPVVAGDVVIIKTTHSAYNFRLKEGERFIMGCTA